MERFFHQKDFHFSISTVQHIFISTDMPMDSILCEPLLSFERFHFMFSKILQVWVFSIFIHMVNSASSILKKSIAILIIF